MSNDRQYACNACNSLDVCLLDNREAFHPFSEKPTESAGIIPGNFSNQLHRNHHRKTTAPPPSEKLRRVD